MTTKSIIFTLLLFLIFPLISIAQKGDKSNESFISIITSINYYPEIPPYQFLGAFNSNTDNQLILDFIDSNSGTFTIEEGETVLVDRTNTSSFPSQIMGMGLGLRIQKEDNLVHEISLTKFSLVKSSHFIEYIFSNADEELRRIQMGYKQKSGAFALRYEIGKLFGNKRSKVRFGLTGGIEPNYYFIKRSSLSINDYPIKANIYTVDFSLIPSLTINVSKKMFLDFKVISNLLAADFSPPPVETYPILAPDMREGELEDDTPAISWAFTVQFRYNIKEPKRKGRRR